MSIGRYSVEWCCLYSVVVFEKKSGYSCWVVKHGREGCQCTLHQGFENILQPKEIIFDGSAVCEFLVWKHFHLERLGSTWPLWSLCDMLCMRNYCSYTPFWKSVEFNSFLKKGIDCTWWTRFITFGSKVTISCTSRIISQETPGLWNNLVFLFYVKMLL